MRTWGIMFVFLGFLWFFWSFNLDTSIPINGELYGHSRVENLGLIAQRQNHLFGAGLMILIGAMMAIFGGAAGPAQPQAVSHPAVPDHPPCERDLSEDGYRLWLAARYDIHRNDVFDRFVLGDQIFESLEMALVHADHCEKIRIADESRRNQEHNRELEQAAEFKAEDNAQMSKIILVTLAFGAASAFAFSLIGDWETKEMASREAASIAEGRKEMREALAGWNFDIPEAWVLTEIKTVTLSDYEIWCDKNAGVLIDIKTNELPEKVIYFLDDALGKGRNPYSNLVESNTINSRIYKRKDGRELRLNAADGSAYICILDSM